MPKLIHEMAEEVGDEASFVEFLSALAREWSASQEREAEHPSSPFGASALGWENTSLGAFLEAAASWAEATSEGLDGYELPSNPWRRIAHMLCAGKFYE